MTLLDREQRLVFLQAPRGNVLEKEKASDIQLESQERLRQRVYELQHSHFESYKAAVGILATPKDIEDIKQGLRMVPLDADEIAYWQSYLLEKGPAAAEAAQKKFNALIETAKGEKLLGSKGTTEWMKRFYRIGREEKEHIVHNALPKWIEQVRGVMQKRNALKGLPRVALLKKEKVPRIAEFLNDEHFMELKVGQQKSLIAMVEAALMSKEKGKDTVYDDAKAQLEEAIRQGHLHPNKLGTWLKRVMNHSKPEAYVATTLKYFLTNWKAIAWEFDDLQGNVSRSGISNVFEIANRMTFLSWSFPKCKKYIADKNKELTLARISEAGEKKERDATVHIRHAMKVRDWSGAEHYLMEALAEFPDNPELLSFKKTIEKHRKEIEEERHADDEVPVPQLNKEINTMVDSLPMEVKDMALECCKHDAQTKDENTQATRMLRGVLFNSEWVRQRHYTNDAQRDEEMKSTEVEEETKRHIDEGHEKKLERNKVAGSTARHEAINGKPVAPEYIYATPDTSSQKTVASALIHHKDSADLKYWGILETPIPRAKVQNLAYNTLPTIGRKLGNLLRRGGEFSRHGPSTHDEQKPKEDEKAA